MRKPVFRRQSGLTLVSTMIVLAIALFFVMIGLKMVPTYLENYSIAQVLESASADRSLRDASRAEIKNLLLKRFKINGVYEFRKEDLKVTANEKMLKVSVDYEVRKPVVGNVFIVMAFSNSAEIRK